MKIPDLLEIAVAWKRAAKPTPEQAAVADARLAVCATCAFRTYSEVIHTFTCSACGCPLNKKVFSPKGPDACPEGRWSE